MAFTTYPSSTDLTELIPAELIDEYCAGFEYPAPAAMSIPWVRGGMGNVPIRFPRWNQMSLAADISQTEETDAFTEEETDTTESSVTPDLYGFTIKVPDQVAAGAIAGLVPASLIDEGMQTLIDYMHTSFCANFANGTVVVGAVTDDYTMSRFRSDLASYKALEIPLGGDAEGIALVLSHAGASDLLGSLHSSGATLLRSSGDTLELGPRAGALGVLHEVNVIETVRTPDSSTGAAGALTPVGFRKSGLGLVVNEGPSVRATRGDTAESTASTWYHYRLWFGSGIVNPRRFIEVAHQR